MLARFGCIGKNNPLVTPSFGPRIGLGATFIYAELEPTGSVDFDPCSTCKVNCRRICPENAMKEKALGFESIRDTEQLPARDEHYAREICNIRMEKDITESKNNSSGAQRPVKFCRRCEFFCPVGQ